MGLQMLFALSTVGGGGGCWNKLFLEKHPMTDPEFDFSRSLDFAVGDQFELLQDMYLYNNMEGYDDMGGTAEFWELNHKEPGNPLPLECVVPEGEVVEIMALKMSRYQKYLNVYLQMRDGKKWVLNYVFEWPNGHYNRELFKKITNGLSEYGDQEKGPESETVLSDEKP